MQSDANSPFKSNRLGVTMNENGFPRVHGDLVSDGWNTRCWRLAAGEISNPNINDDSWGIHPIQCCPFRDDPCNNNNPDWSSIADVNKAIDMSNYDGGEYDIDFQHLDNFRNFMEGFNVLSNYPAGRDACSANRHVKHIPITRRLHSSVSTISIIPIKGICFLWNAY